MNQAWTTEAGAAAGDQAWTMEAAGAETAAGDKAWMVEAAGAEAAVGDQAWMVEQECREVTPSEPSIACKWHGLLLDSERLKKKPWPSSLLTGPDPLRKPLRRLPAQLECLSAV